MNATVFHTARLAPGDLDELQALESELGVTLVAFESDSSSSPAQLNEEQLQRIRALEDRTGKVLLALN